MATSVPAPGRVLPLAIAMHVEYIVLVRRVIGPAALIAVSYLDDGGASWELKGCLTWLESWYKGMGWSLVIGLVLDLGHRYILSLKYTAFVSLPIV